MPKSVAEDSISQQAEVLQKEIDILQKLLGDEDPQEIVARHIKLLHTYNESKDAGQVLLGRLASIKQTTLAKIHEEYGLPLHD
ncbi:Swi5-domain-containing protein [Ceratobasidium sp. AG-I]|nr:Swi5-domain-containing protein [Ceratobasidium sp. AG-I]